MPLQNFGSFGKGLWRCAQPDIDGFSLLHALGVRTIFKLNEDGVSLDEEMQMARLSSTRTGSLAIVPEVMNPILRLHNREQVYRVIRLMQAVNDHGDGLVVHCTHGRDRTGQIVAAWRVVVEGWPVADAKREWAMYGGGVLSKIFDHPDFEMLELIAAERLRPPV